jgi:hypothetical protein
MRGQQCGLGTEESAPVCGSASVTAAAEDVGQGNADDQGTSGAILLWWFGEIRIESRECGAPNRTAVLRSLLSRGWNDGSQGLLFIL